MDVSPLGAGVLSE